MKNICKYEFYKLYKSKLFLLLTALILGSNLLAVYVYDRNTVEYSQQENYAVKYETFVQEMEERAEGMKKANIFMNKDSYVYRNLQKTCKDYQKLLGNQVEEDNNSGIWRQVSYKGGIAFTFMFLGVLIYQLIFYEREQNLFLLIKVGKCGRLDTALSKLVVAFVSICSYVVLQSVGEFLYYGCRYGYGDVSRSIQSFEVFRNCTEVLNVAEYVILCIVDRTIVAVLMGIFLYACGMWKKNSISVLVLTAVFLGIELWCYIGIGLNSSINWLKCLNIFYYWNPRNVWGDYINLNFWEYPVSRNLCAGIVALLFLCFMALIGICAYVYGYQQRQESILEIWLQKARQKIGCHPKTTRLLYYELYKVLIQQKKIIVAALLLIFFIGEMKAAIGQESYQEPAIASYHSYMQELSGKITQDTLDYMDEKNLYFETISRELISLENVTSGSAYLRRLELQSEIEMNEQGFYMVENQLEWLKGQAGDVTDKYLIDEQAYIKLWNDSKTDIFLMFIGSLASLIFINGLFTADKEKSMENLIFVPTPKS